MLALPVIVAMGGINAGGRGSTLCSYRRTVLDCLSGAAQDETILELAALMGLAAPQDDGWLVKSTKQQLDASACAEQLRAPVLAGSLVRSISREQFNSQQLPVFMPVDLSSSGDVAWHAASPRYGKNRVLSKDSGWSKQGLRWARSEQLEDDRFFCSGTFDLGVSVAAGLPAGFNLSSTYRSVSHPRALQMAIFAISDALGSLGLDIARITHDLSPDQVAVFASNSIGQLDDDGWGGMLRGRFCGEAPHSKQMPLGYPQMCADFINSYVLGSVGKAGSAVGACATFLYNLQLAVRAIQQDGCKLAVVGTTDAPILPEIMEGFNSMGALASDDKLQNLAKYLELDDIAPEHSSRPFGNNCGFVMGESSQFVVLMADDLALSVGAPILGAVPDCCVHADGYKKSIASPGPGNFLSLGQACASLEDILGTHALRTRSFVQAHGTGTPVNRITESQVLSQVAVAFQIDAWPVVAVKAFYGHSQGSGAGDQLSSSIGVFEHGIMPGLSSIETVAKDVNQDHLSFSLQPRQVDPEHYQGCVLNAKGFGGNNASAAMLSAASARDFLARRHGQSSWRGYQRKLDATETERTDYRSAAQRGAHSIRYQVAADNNLQPEVQISSASVTVAGYPAMAFRRGKYGTAD